MASWSASTFIKCQLFHFSSNVLAIVGDDYYSCCYPWHDFKHFLTGRTNSIHRNAVLSVLLGSKMIYYIAVKLHSPFTCNFSYILCLPIASLFGDFTGLSHSVSFCYSSTIWFSNATNSHIFLGMSLRVLSCPCSYRDFCKLLLPRINYRL